MAMATKIGRNFGYVWTRSSTGGNAAAFTRRRETAIVPSAPNYCTRSSPSPRDRWIMDKTIKFIVAIGLPIILPCSILYWMERKRIKSCYHRNAKKLKERFQLTRNADKIEGDKV